MPAPRRCPQNLNVMQYIAYAQRGEFEKCAEESFDCVGCGMLYRPLPGRHFPSDGRTAGKKTDRKVHCARRQSTWTKRVEDIHHGQRTTH